MSEPVHVIDDLDALQVLGHPLRVRILGALHQPDSAAAVARAIGENRQRVHYHVKELARAGLVEQAGERRVGNFVETLYRSVARSFVVAPGIAWTDPVRVDTLRQQASLERLVDVGARLQRDAIALLDRAAFDGEQIASAAVEADVHFADEQVRAEFLDAYLDAVRELCDRFGACAGLPYRIVMAAHPAAVDQQGDEP